MENNLNAETNIEIFDLEQLPSYLPSEVKHKIEIDVNNLPSIISEQADTLKKFSSEKEKAEEFAKIAKDKAAKASELKLKWYKSDKKAIETLQSAAQSEAEAIEQLSEAIKAAFDNQSKIKKVSDLLLGIGLANTTLNRMVIRELEMKLSNASKEQLSELARQELESVIKQLKAQEDMMRRIERQKESILKLESSIKEIADNNHKLSLRHEDFILKFENTIDSTLKNLEQKHSDDIDSLSRLQREAISQMKSELEELSSQLKKRGETLMKNQEVFVTQNKQIISEHLASVDLRQKETSNMLQEQQKKWISNLQESVDSFQNGMSQSYDGIKSAQQEFINHIQAQQDQSRVDFQNKVDLFVTSQNELYEAMKKQMNFYKVISFLAMGVSIFLFLFMFMIK